MPKPKPQFARPAAMSLLGTIAAATSLAAVVAILRTVAAAFPARIGKKITWGEAFARLVTYFENLANPGQKPAFRIFGRGNGKLPFWTFSVVPIFTCPGRGACENWCYSLKAWQYPAAFGRQLQNWLLLRFSKATIRAAFAKLPQNAILRLYVDGDFANLAELGFWFGLLHSRPDIRCYGYSKSLDLFLEWHSQGLPFPTNYRLNLSGGGRFVPGSAEYEAIRELPIFRGEFLALPVTGKYKRGNAKYKQAEYHAEVREAIVAETGGRGFSCPGDCGNCGIGEGNHACGSDRFYSIPIGIGIH